MTVSSQNNGSTAPVTTTGTFNTTSTTYVTALSKTGQGRLKELRGWITSAGQCYVKITIDGVVVVSDWYTTTGLQKGPTSYVGAIKGLGGMTYGRLDLPYKTSLLIEIKNPTATNRCDVAWTIEE